MIKPALKLTEKTVLREKGFLNRHTDGLPKKECIIFILYNDQHTVEEIECTWKPFEKNNYPENNQPAKGFLGTATRNKGIQIGFHAWMQNDYEFIYYRIAEPA